MVPSVEHFLNRSYARFASSTTTTTALAPPTCWEQDYQQTWIYADLHDGCRLHT